jgi:predicted ATP-grasp superfamily ATP-dependent carboligase
MHDAPTPLVVIGASARAFATSAVRAGWRVYAADLFADLDLQAAAAGTACVRDFAGGYPTGFVAAVRSFPVAAFCYVGAMENHTAVIRAIARERTLLGSAPEAFSAVRDPWSLQRLVRHAGLASPECRTDPDGAPRDGSFLVKPLASAGGHGIAPWDVAARSPMGTSVWQRRVVGVDWSAAYIVSAAGGRLLGASRQLVGLPWCYARPFAYCGSIDEPLAGVPTAVRRQFAALGSALAACGLRGAVGVDAVVDASGTVWVIEVNPRPCASMELIERATGQSIAAAHLAACGGAVAEPPAHPATPLRWAKAVLYAPQELVVDGAWLDRVAAWQREWSAGTTHAAIADIPASGRTVPVGGPVCTLFAAAATPALAIERLRERAAALVAPVTRPDGGAGPPAVTRSSIP